MNLQNTVLPLALAMLLMGCGGTVSKNDGGGSAGTLSMGASAGTLSFGGTGNESGASAGGTAPTVGGTFGTAGSLNLGGAPSCATVTCTAADCLEGQVPVLRPGACCTTCEPQSDGCEEVKCQPVEACAEGYELAQPAGACCVGCVPQPGVVACREVACPQTSCPLGYVRGDEVGGCCYDCVPDPLYCRGIEDCVMAEQPNACCGCPEAITRRQYQREPCWSQPGSPRPLPPTCYPQLTCDALCGACDNDGQIAVCSQRRCMSRPDTLR